MSLQKLSQVIYIYDMDFGPIFTEISPFFAKIMKKCSPGLKNTPNTITIIRHFRKGRKSLKKLQKVKKVRFPTIRHLGRLSSHIYTLCCQGTSSRFSSKIQNFLKFHTFSDHVKTPYKRNHISILPGAREHFSMQILENRIEKLPKSYIYTPSH